MAAGIMPYTTESSGLRLCIYRACLFALTILAASVIVQLLAPYPQDVSYFSAVTDQGVVLIASVSQ